MPMSSSSPLAKPHKHRRSVHALYIKLVCQDLEHQGIPVERSLRAAQLPEDFIENGDGMVSIHEFHMLYDFARQETKDHYLGLHIGSKIFTNHHGPLGYLISSSPTAEAALKSLVKFVALRTQLLELELKEEGEGLRLIVNEKADLQSARIFFLEALISLLINAFKTIFQRDLEGLKLELAYEAEGRETKYQEYFNCPISFSRKQTVLVFPKATAQLKNMMADAKAFRLAEIECQNLYDNLIANDGLKNKIEEIILNSENQFPTLEEVAEELGMSKSTLIRKLSKSGISYKKIVNDIRYELATYYLIETQLPVESIAEKLGFQDTSNFSRVFKRWKNTSPSEFRKDYKSQSQT
jgi:AraC-like DNA-binding protein